MPTVSSTPFALARVVNSERLASNEYTQVSTVLPASWDSAAGPSRCCARIAGAVGGDFCGLERLRLPAASCWTHDSVRLCSREWGKNRASAHPVPWARKRHRRHGSGSITPLDLW